MHKYLGLILLLLFIFSGGCSKSDTQSDIPSDSITTSKPLEKINYINSSSDIIGLTVSSEDELFVHERNGYIKRYNSEGTLIKEYPHTIDLIAMCWYEGTLYAYDAVKTQIVSMNIEDGTITPVSENLEVEMIQNFTVAGNYLYLLAIPEVEQYNVTRLYQIDITSGKIRDTNEENILAVYGASDGTLYYYANRDNAYALYTYDSAKGNSQKLYDMNGIGQISAFVYENDYMIFSPLTEPCLRAIKSSENFDAVLDKDIIIPSGNFISYSKGNLVYFGVLLDSDKENSIKSIFIDDIDNFVDPDDEIIPDMLVIWAPQPFFLDASKINKKSGLNAKIIERIVQADVLLTEIMSGSSDIDIYITNFNSPLANGIKEKGMHVPLNESKTIMEYKEKYFDYIADSMQTPSGDVWMLPLYINAYVIWYVPENTERFNIKPEDFSNFNSFMDLCSRMPKTGSFAAYIDSPYSFWIGCYNQYNLFFNDYSNKKVNFDTALLKNIFDKLWTGVEYKAEYGRYFHPVFRSSIDDYHGELLLESSAYDKTKLIFKCDLISEQLNIPQKIKKHYSVSPEYPTEYTLEGWRALPEPRISPDVNKNVINMWCAFINPYSKNKENAIKYMEAIAKHPFDFITYYTTAIYFKDKEMYANVYDITQPAFDDVYNIMSNGIINSSRFYPSNVIIDDYISGKLTLNEAIAKIQREAEMWLNE